MRINSRGHMVFRSEREAETYAHNAGFEVRGEVASRPDMDSKFTLTPISKGPNDTDYMWYRPYTSVG